ncbi:SWIM zinc finger family protein [Candidatus Woesearchaeota archaeon]|nr:SWIM zinc finger family protein [Candidatus Woesearchaeota archaeon]
MKVTPSDDGTYFVESSRKEKHYVVDPKEPSCSCPHFTVTMKKKFGWCKHIRAVKDFAEGRDEGNYQKIVDFVREKGSVELLELERLFNKEAVDDLICQSLLKEARGIVHLRR